MITKQDDLLGTLIHDVAHNLRLTIDKKLAPYNLTRTKWLALGIICKHPSITQSELASKMELGNATVGRLIDRMEERGFVERRPAPDDRRSYEIHPTDAAKQVVDELGHIADDLRDDALAAIAPSDVQKVNKVLIVMKNNLLARLSIVGAAIFGLSHRFGESFESVSSLALFV